MDLTKSDNEDESRISDKNQIEAEEKEIMLKPENGNIDKSTEDKNEPEGPVKSALACEVTDQGREVKRKFIPIGAIKMPGFFTRNTDKDKTKEEDGVEKDGEGLKNDETTKTKRHYIQYLHSCPFTKFLHHPRNENESVTPATKKRVNILNVKYFRFLKKDSSKDPEAALASMETLEDKLETPNDGMENVKLDIDETDEGKIETKLPLRERIRQKKFILEDIVVCSLVFLVMLVVVLSIVLSARAGPPAERPLRLGRYMTTLTSCGPVEGVLEDGVYNFYNIPYAAAPIGDKRFANAQPLNNISMCWNETREAHKPGPICTQFLENGTVTGEEDCLTLDIVTPHVRYDSHLPVVVLIGANSLSGGISPAQPSALYSRTKEVVFVKVNFRLGPFGFLALDILSNTKYPPTSGNFALSDIIVALDWIKNNIKHFGGNHESVTLLGHRAGATLTAALTTVHKAQKLYTRVWLSSPSVIFPGENLEESEKYYELFKKLSKCDNVQCLREMPTAEIWTATPDVWLSNNMGTLPTSNESKHSWLVLDGDFLRMHAYESWDAQKEAKEIGRVKNFKPMVFGTTQHSSHTESLKMKHLNWTQEIVEKIVNESIIGKKNLTIPIFENYNKTYEGMVELISSIRTFCPLVSLARWRLKTPLYYVLGSGAGGGIAGSGIADINADVEAILGTFNSNTPEQRRFMSAMQLLFYYYVWHGQLPGPENGLIAVEQDLLALNSSPACDLLIGNDIVPRFAHVD